MNTPCKHKKHNIMFHAAKVISILDSVNIQVYEHASQNRPPAVQAVREGMVD